MATNQRTKYNANAFLPNLDLIYAAGLDPKTGLPRKLSESSCALKENIKRQLTSDDIVTKKNGTSYIDSLFKVDAKTDRLKEMHEIVSDGKHKYI